MLLEIVQTAIDDILASDDPQLCSAMADHVHNLPGIVLDYWTEQLEWYWQCFVGPKHPPLDQVVPRLEPWWAELRRLVIHLGLFDPDAEPEWMRQTAPTKGIRGVWRRLHPGRTHEPEWNPFIPTATAVPVPRIRIGTTRCPLLLDLLTIAILDVRALRSIEEQHGAARHIRRLPKLVLDCDADGLRQYWHEDRTRYMASFPVCATTFGPEWAELEPAISTLGNERS